MREKEGGRKGKREREGERRREGGESVFRNVHTYNFSFGEIELPTRKAIEEQSEEKNC